VEGGVSCTFASGCKAVVGVSNGGVMTTKEYSNAGAPVRVPGVLGYEMWSREWVLRPAKGVFEVIEAHSDYASKCAVPVIQE
jgi:hypothetical protein